MLADRLRMTTKVALAGQQAYTTAGTYTFTVPAGVTSICAVCVGGGQGGTNSLGGAYSEAGALAYKNSITVSAGENWTVVVGAGSNGTGDGNSSASAGSSYLQAPNLSVEVRAIGGAAGGTNIGTAYNGGTAVQLSNGGGGGAAGYSGNGGNGGYSANAGSSGSGGGGGGGGGGSVYYENPGDPLSGIIEANGGGGGGGVGILGSGSSGAGGSTGGSGGGGGSSGTSGTGAAFIGGGGGAYGGAGGQGGSYYEPSSGTTNYSGGNGASGAVRIIWGTGRSYPSNAANV